MAQALVDQASEKASFNRANHKWEIVKRRLGCLLKSKPAKVPNKAAASDARALEIVPRQGGAAAINKPERVPNGTAASDISRSLEIVPHQKSVAAINEPETENKCTLGNCKCGQECRISLGISEGAVCACTKPCPFQKGICLCGYSDSDKSPNCPPFCPLCEMYYGDIVRDIKEFEKVHKDVLTMPAEVQQKCHFCEGSRSSPCIVYQVKAEQSDTSMANVVEKLVRRSDGYSIRFVCEDHPERQAFIAVSKTEPSRILGFCIAERINWLVDVRSGYDRSRFESKNDLTKLPSDKYSVSFLWVHRPNRYQKVGWCLLEAVRNNFLENSIIPKEKLGMKGFGVARARFIEHYLDGYNWDRFWLLEK